MIHILSDVLRESTMITAFVLIIMLFIEVLNIATRGAWSKALAEKPFLQIVIATLLGTLPGCFGGFAMVSMYTHGIVHFGALMAAMISNIGDEAFVMLVQMPQDTFWLMLILFVLSMAVGCICWKLAPQRAVQPAQLHFELHQDDNLSLADMAKDWRNNLKHLTFTRALLLVGVLAFIVTLLLGGFEHSHLPQDIEAHEHAHEHSGIMLEESYFNMVFLVLAVLVLITLLIVNDHFLEHHLWGHVIKHHFLTIFCWVFVALFVIALINKQLLSIHWLNQSPWLMLLTAVLIGLIPQSGPHLIVIGLYLSGQVPFVVMMANAIVQDGHSALPLFAESKKTFVVMKLIKVALAVGIALIWL